MYRNGIDDFIAIHRDDAAKCTPISLFGDPKTRKPELIPIHNDLSFVSIWSNLSRHHLNLHIDFDRLVAHIGQVGLTVTLNIRFSTVQNPNPYSCPVKKQSSNGDFYFVLCRFELNSVSANIVGFQHHQTDLLYGEIPKTSILIH